MVVGRMSASKALITGFLYHKKPTNGKIKPRKVTFGSLESGVHYIDIYHETKPKQKYKIKIDKENFAGLETGDAVYTENGVFRKKTKQINYLAVILKNATIFFMINCNEVGKWKQTITKELKHKSKWDGTLLQPQNLSDVSLQLMSTVVSIVEKKEDPKCLRLWKVDDIEEICIVNSNCLQLKHKRDGVYIFQPDHGLQNIYKDLKIMAQINNMDVIVVQPPLSVLVPCPDSSPERPRKPLRRSSSVIVPEDLETNPQYSTRKRVSIYGHIKSPNVQVPVVEENNGNTCRASSDPNLYYNQLNITEFIQRQHSEIPTNNIRDSIEDFFEGEYDYSSLVMNFVYRCLCKRQEDSIPNLLQIGGITRRKLGLKLFNVSTPETGSWKDLSMELCEMSVQDADYFSCLRQQQLCSQGLTETEMILKYWEYMASTEPEYRNHFKYACNRTELVSLLQYLNREDLAELVLRSAVR